MNAAIIGPIVPQTDSVPREDMQTTLLSPYSAKRAAIRDLTVPPMPILNIPPSPPGSPLPENEKKFQHFLELKKQGIHFNEKLANSSALKNPNLLQKLMDHAGLDEQDQYSFTFSENLFSPRKFPPWAYKEELARSQQIVAKKKEEERAKAPHENIEFVSAAGSGPSGKGSTTTVNNGVRGVQGSAAERVMAGMDGASTISPQRSAQSVRSEHNRRSGIPNKNGPSRGIPSSPKRRKRSRSR